MTFDQVLVLNNVTNKKFYSSFFTRLVDNKFGVDFREDLSSRQRLVIYLKSHYGEASLVEKRN